MSSEETARITSCVMAGAQTGDPAIARYSLVSNRGRDRLTLTRAKRLDPNRNVTCARGVIAALMSLAVVFLMSVLTSGAVVI